MKIWKAILATLVIFAAGMFAGSVVTKRIQPPSPVAKSSPTPPPVIYQQRFHEKLKRELELTADQTNRLNKIFTENNENVRIIWRLMEPELQKQRQEAYENIRSVLTATQREKFDRLIKEHPPRKPDFDGQRSRGPRNGETNRNKGPRPEGPKPEGPKPAPPPI